MHRYVLLAGALALTACANESEQRAIQQGALAATKLSLSPDRIFTNGDVIIRYREAGRRGASPVVFIHGYSRSLEDWFALADSFATNHRVIAFDVRGFGKSSKFSDPLRYGHWMADDVVALLDYLGIERAHLVGHSMGALIAGNVAERYPKRVASVSLVSGPFYSDSVTHAQQSERWVRDLERGQGMRNFLPWLFPGMPDSIARRLSVETMVQNDSTSMVEVMRTIPALAVTAPRLDGVPAFIAVGGGDPLAPLSRSLSQRWTNARFLEIPGVDHIQIMGRPEIVAGMRALIQ